ncbi:DUF6172 family protein [Oleiharenicola sp. Vm1]|uniref:DUF6172 family protein n=1 Tax=Oleiharenicola sp. Vm1 TaxID=3398393 RepID=UPI0039F4ECF0
MKKTFPLQQAGRDDARVRDKIRHEVNKFLRRARQRPPAEGFRGWDFTCRVGPSESEAEPRTLKEVAGEIDAIAARGAAHVYIELIPVPARRVPATDEAADA